jgi:uncharacterized membrane protein YjgN (DUF898 family)
MTHVPTIERGAAPAAPDSDTERLEAQSGPLAGLVVTGTLLTIITVGIYRFWYRTNLRRYYWSNTRFHGDGFEYTGTGRELFIGFLIALAIIVPLNLSVTLISVFVGGFMGPILATIAAFLVIPAIVQIALYRARRYRLSRTRYRGIRLSQTGTGMAYLARTVQWLILTLLTLGIAFPYLSAAQERYKIANTWFGTAQGAFAASAKSLLPAWLPVWGCGIGAALVLAGAASLDVIGSVPGIAATGILATALLLALPFLWVRYRVREFRVFTAGTTLGALGFASDLGFWPIIWIHIRYYLVLAGIVIVLGLFAYSASPFFAGDFDERALGALMHGGAGPVLVFAAILTFLILAAVLMELLLRRPLWVVTTRSVRVLHVGALDQILQGAAQDSLGVGEAFDTDFGFPG